MAQKLEVCAESWEADLPTDLLTCTLRAQPTRRRSRRVPTELRSVGSVLGSAEDGAAPSLASGRIQKSDLRPASQTSCKPSYSLFPFFLI